jgi:hypothetical protein
MQQAAEKVKHFLDIVNNEIDKFEEEIDYQALIKARNLILDAEKNRIGFMSPESANRVMLPVI